MGKVLNYIDKYNFIQANEFLDLVNETYIIWLKDKISINVTEYDSQIIINNMIHIFDTLYDMAGLISEHISVTGGITSNSSFHINDFEVIEALLDLLSRLPKQVSNNFSYGWEGFSTGELAKLNIFSSIYNYIKKSISFTTLFILDEVDLYLHPEWQRTFISELISFLKSEADTSTIQLLITTHSPLIIGDFLPEDIISLQNNNDGHTYVTEAYGFGTEITDAYISGMHISSTFGEHSREKLLKLIDRKLNGELRDEDSWLISKLKDSSIKRMLTK
ncbi:TPA: AAA family ATPase [Enterobacter roggenkampii]|nr:AAA family ATPase [Enterobacter roggenkampii]